jgi:hypothetical protein
VLWAAAAAYEELSAARRKLGRFLGVVSLLKRFVGAAVCVEGSVCSSAGVEIAPAPFALAATVQ